MLMHANLSPCGKYRWSLTRCWDERAAMLVVVMLNPSTADSTTNDPTILTLMKFAKSWGFGGLWVVNLFGYRSPHPSDLAALDPCTAQGPLNYLAWNDALQYAADNGGWALAAWGNGGDGFPYLDVWADLHGVDFYCLGTTASGAPKHPLARGKHRIPADQKPTLWRQAARRRA